MKRSNHSRRGMTLIEVMVAATIMTAVMAAAVAVIRTGVRVATLNEQTVDTNDASRVAGDRLVFDLRSAGTMGGVYVTGGGAPILINPIFSVDNVLRPNTDEVWIIVPSRTMMQADCARPGSAAVLTQASVSGQPLQVNCTGQFATARTLLVTNFNRAALISVAAMTPTTITYNEAAAPGFSNDPTKGSFQRGDYIVPVNLVRWRISPNDIAGQPDVLKREVFDLDFGNVTAATPFGATAPGNLVRGEIFNNIEDLQVAWGSGVAPALTFTSAHGSAYLGGNGGNFGTQNQVPVSVRVNLVGRTPRAIRNEAGEVMDYRAITVEDHVPPVVPFGDGFRRTLYRRRVELQNMGALSL